MLPALIESLLDPASYSHDAGRVQLAQTHISYVLLAGEYVYKIKKPVDFGFLDFSTLELRKHFCEEEVRLNRRLCPSVYLGVVPIVTRGGGFSVEEGGEAVEYAVKMKRLPAERMMDVLVERAEATPDMFGEVARVLAKFHAGARSGPDVSRFGSVEAVRANTDENFEQTSAYVEITLTKNRYEFIQAYTRRFLANGAAFLRRRAETGRIREGHGDMHLANICYTDAPCIYDCIEFSERLRCGDVAGEVAFLAMDLDFHGRSDLSHEFVDAYVAASGDGDLYQMLDFYKCYRAYVRGKVCSFAMDEPEMSDDDIRCNLDDARRYFDLAYRYAGGRTRPSLVVMCGMSGTGKSVVAEGIAEQLGAVVIRSDSVRKHLAGAQPSDSMAAEFGSGIYTSEMTERTYQAMLDDAARLLAAGHGVILDATFATRVQRDAVRATATRADARFLLVECRAPEEEVRRRLDAREIERAAASDATWQVYLKQKTRFEPPDEMDEFERISIDTTLGMAAAAEEVSLRLAEEQRSPARA